MIAFNETYDAYILEQDGILFRWEEQRMQLRKLPPRKLPLRITRISAKLRCFSLMI